MIDITTKAVWRYSTRLRLLRIERGFDCPVTYMCLTSLDSHMQKTLVSVSGGFGLDGSPAMC